MLFNDNTVESKIELKIDDSFTMAVSNLFLSPLEKKKSPIAADM